MKKLLSLLCAAVLILGCGFTSGDPIEASFEPEAAPIPTVPESSNTISSSNANRLSHYSTGAIANYNYANFDFSGNWLTVTRGAFKLPNGPDQIMIKQNGAVVQEHWAEWAYQPAEGITNGYVTSVDLGGLAEGSYSVEIKTKDTYYYILVTQGFRKDSEGCYFPRNNTVSKKYNYDVLTRLNNGDVPDDFSALKTLYDTDENKATMRAIEAKAKELTRGKSSTADKIQAINDWLIHNIAYDQAIGGDEYYTLIEKHPNEQVRLDNPLHAFTQGYAVCYGYARLTTLMMGYAGVDCVYITGRLANESIGNINKEPASARQEDKLNHAWNAVKVGGSWQFIDPSLDSLSYYYRTNSADPKTGYIETPKIPLYQLTFPSLDYISETHIALRLGYKNYGTKLNSSSIPNGWKKDGTSSFYYIDGKKLQNEWKTIDDKTYYFTSTGAMAVGWQMADEYWRYFDEEGAVTTGALELKEGTETREYTFDSKGRLTGDGWITFQGKNRYFQGVEMLTGWQFTAGGWRYFDDTGALYRDEKNPLVQDEREYKVDKDGVLQVDGTGWLTFGGERHYFEEGTPLSAGLRTIGGREYLLGPGGTMLIDWQTVDGKTYYLNEQGQLQTGWMFLDDGWYYLDRDKGRFTGVQTLGGKKLFFNSQGHLSSSGWVDVAGGRVYFNGGETKDGVGIGGKLLKGWQNADGKLRFYDRDNGLLFMGPGEKYNANNQRWYTISNGEATLKS